MKKTITRTLGFSLLELMVASAVGLLVIAAMASLFKIGMDATFTVTQRAETQQNMRAAIELMTKDISLAGSGLPSGGLQLVVNGGASKSKFACNQFGVCYLPNNTYPNSSIGVQNYMYGIIPGFNNGVQGAAVITAAPGQVNDSITSIYCDYNFSLTNFTFTFPTTTQATVTVNNVAVQPNNILAAGGLAPGDLILFIVSSPGNGTGTDGTSLIQTGAVVAEVTSIPNNTTIDFAAGDVLNFNQAAGGMTNNLASVIPLGAGAQMSTCRLNAVTYFLQVPAAGGTVQTPRLMRQVNGQDAIPVADNIINLQITYDVINSTAGTISANQVDPIGAGSSPALIQKVNLWVMGQSTTTAGRKAQSMYLASSVSARNMSFCNSYSSSTTSCN